MLTFAITLAIGQIWQSGYPLSDQTCVGRTKARKGLTLPGFRGRTREKAFSWFRYDSGKMTISIPRPSAGATAPVMIEVRELQPEGREVIGGKIDDLNGGVAQARYDWTREELTLSSANWSFRGKCHLTSLRGPTVRS